MKKDDAPKSDKLEDNTLWREACDLAEYMYGKLHEFHDEEKWETARKLRSSANDVMFYVSQAVGNASPGATEYDWGAARKYACALKTMYRFAGRQKFIELEPEMMVRIDRFIQGIDKEVAAAYKQTEDKDKKDFEYWQRRAALQKEATA